MSNRLFQGIVHQMTDSIDRVIGVVDDREPSFRAASSEKSARSFRPRCQLFFPLCRKA